VVAQRPVHQVLEQRVAVVFHAAAERCIGDQRVRYEHADVFGRRSCDLQNDTVRRARCSQLHDADPPLRQHNTGGCTVSSGVDQRIAIVRDRARRLRAESASGFRSAARRRRSATSKRSPQ
jgi:hypothetical protein